MKLLCIWTWRTPLTTLEKNPYLPLNDRNKNPAMCKESQTACATNNSCAACRFLEKSDKITIAQMWLKTLCFFFGGGGEAGVAYARNNPLHKISVADRVVSCGVGTSVPPDSHHTQRDCKYVDKTLYEPWLPQGSACIFPLP
jgi:hypothetical protein